MMISNPEGMDVEELIRMFVEFAIGQDAAQDYAEYENEEDYGRIGLAVTQGWEVRDELKRRVPDARRALLALYDHPNVQVRLNAAAATLAVAPVEARRLIEAIVTWQHYPQTAQARELIRALDRGTFRPT